MVIKNKKSNEIDKTALNYFKDISKCSPLSREEEYNLWERYKKHNDIGARNKLVSSNLKFVASVAKNYQGMGLSYSDLIAEGNVGLIKALEKFDGDKGNKIISYSVWWIKQSILEALNKRNSMEAEDLPTETSKSELNFDSDEYIQEIENNLPDNYINEESEVLQKMYEEKKIINLLFEPLSQREKKIVSMYYGIDGYKERTLEEIGKEFGITKERIRQIIAKCFKKMRSAALSFDVDETIYI